MTHRSFHLTALQAAACAFVAAACGSANAVAIAGTDLQITGRIVAGIDVTSNVAKTDGSGESITQVRGASNQWGTSMLTFAAEHPLSGGNVGFATLESGFGANNGGFNGSTIWNRRAFVGLKNDSWGKLQFGKNLSISNDVWDFDPMGQNWTGSESLIGGRNWNGADGAAEYWTPDLGGFGAGVQLAPTNDSRTAAGTKSGRKAGIDVFYSGGPIKVHAIYDTAQDANGLYSDAHAFSKEYIIGGTYQIGAAKLFVGYNHSSAPDAPGVNPGAATTAKQGWAGVQLQSSDALLLRAAIFTGGTNIDPTGATAAFSGKRGTLVALGADYSLDKQVLIWSTLAAVTNGKNSTYSSEDTWDTEPLPGKGQQTFNVGFSYSF